MPSYVMTISQPNKLVRQFEANSREDALDKARIAYEELQKDRGTFLTFFTENTTMEVAEKSRWPDCVELDE